MKKVYFVALILSLIAILSIGTTVVLGNESEGNKVIVNEQVLELDVPPVIVDGRILVPLRAIFSALGADVEWVGETQTVKAKKGDISVEIKIDNNVATINGVEKTLDVPAKLINSRTMVPVRFVSESLGANVMWNSVGHEAIISTVKNDILKQYYDDGTLKFEGEAINNLANGYGKEYREDGSLRYEGWYKDGRAYGFGKNYKGSILIYEGGWKDSKLDSLGRAYNSDSGELVFDGMWAQNVFTFGKAYTTINGMKIMYDGNFGENFKYQGNGKYYINDVLAYEGNFENALFSGQGKTYFKNGNVAYEGNFVQGKPEGQGKCYDQNGKLLYEGYFSNGHIMNTTNTTTTTETTPTTTTSTNTGTNPTETPEGIIAKWEENRLNMLINAMLGVN